MTISSDLRRLRRKIFHEPFFCKPDLTPVGDYSLDEGVKEFKCYNIFFMYFNLTMLFNEQ